MVPSEHGGLTAHPRESVSALLILCTYLAGETATSLCPGEQPERGPCRPCGSPNPVGGMWDPWGVSRLLVFGAPLASWHWRASQPPSVPKLKPGLLFSRAGKQGVIPPPLT